MRAPLVSPRPRAPGPPGSIPLAAIVRMAGTTHGPYGSQLDTLRATARSEDFTLVGRRFPAKFVDYGDLRIAFLLGGLRLQWRARLAGPPATTPDNAALERRAAAALINVECMAMDADGRVIIVAYLRDRNGNSTELLNCPHGGGGVGVPLVPAPAAVAIEVRPQPPHAPAGMQPTLRRPRGPPPVDDDSDGWSDLDGDLPVR
jgi:hypothetical protein